MLQHFKLLFSLSSYHVSPVKCNWLTGTTLGLCLDGFTFFLFKAHVANVVIELGSEKHLQGVCPLLSYWSQIFSVTAFQALARLLLTGKLAAAADTFIPNIILLIMSSHKSISHS